MSEQGASDEALKKLEQGRAARQAELERRSLLQKILEPSAFERLSNIRLSNPEMYEKLSSLLLYLAQSGKLGGRVRDVQLRELAERVVSQRRETTIKRI